ncbi:MAG TPA: hypothetical protein VMI73_28985 [Trebonia sp.]|nr:hypothetical protein [Trebonia sp.]
MTEQLYLGWQYATPHADPGPPPRPPAPPAPSWPVSLAGEGWLAAQRREEKLIGRPQRIAVVAAALAASSLAACAAAGWMTVVIAVPAVAACLTIAGLCGLTLWRGQRVLRGRVDAERYRVERLRADRERRLAAARTDHERRVSQWLEQRSAFTRQKRWYAVPVPDGIDRVDVAGGTLAGWSALLTMAAAYRLATGGEVTVIDLSGGAVAADLAGLCADADGTAAGGSTAGGGPPAVWVLPQDLPRLDIAASLPATELAGVLALSASVAEERRSARDLAIDTAILDRVIGVLDPAAGGIGVRRVTAALRALAEVGDPRADLSSGLLTDREAGEIGALFGRAATDRVVLERALAMEAQLRVLDRAGTDPVRLPRSRLRVVALDRRASPQAATAISGFVVTALTRLIGQEPGPAGSAPVSWGHTVFLLGAERLRDDVLDRLADACESGRRGLVLAYRSLPPHVRQRIGRGNAVTVFMRLGNAEEAKAASEQIGTSHRFVLSQLTETVGTSVTDSLGGSYTSTVGDSASAAASASDSESRSTGSGRNRSAAPGVLPLPGAASRSTQEGTSRSTSASASLTAGISTSTAWGLSTSRATGDSESLARSLQRSRELVVEPSELQRLPATAMIISHGDAAARRVLLADANPAIGSLPVATLAPLAGDMGLGGARGQVNAPVTLPAARRGPPPPGMRIPSADDG